MSIYWDKLINIETTHPGLLDDCQKSFLGIRRTMKPFLRIPVDLTLEQTINADAASRASGIINITNSFSVRQKWS
ncbi:GSCOCG00011587001-RA-CDS, partial [Cotesia congregata]